MTANVFQTEAQRMTALARTNIHAALEECGMTAREAGSFAGFDPLMVQHAMDGQDELTVAQVAGLCRVLGVPLASIFEPIAETPELHRITEPGEPEQHGIGCGL
ncbi:hypothetical protein ACR5KS_03000 [Leucobacter sp. W1153]|uniref:hypothetical protein n=1 Tax=Leucobacter sp. W1153 TaxID=3439064 RepID=UPI003F4123D8